MSTISVQAISKENILKLAMNAQLYKKQECAHWQGSGEDVLGPFIPTTTNKVPSIGPIVSSIETAICATSPAPPASKGDSALSSTDFGIIPIPKRLRYDPDKPFHFSLLLNVTFRIGYEVSVQNIPQDANVDTGRVNTLIRYVTGLLLISPLGDLVHRRQLILLLVLAVLCYLIGVANVTPQILLALAADLSAPERGASATSVVLSGHMLGTLSALMLAGSSATSIPKDRDMTYFKILYTIMMAKYAVTEPLIIQAALINMACSACFSRFWVTLTFLLDLISAFSDLFGVLLGPFMGRLIDNFVRYTTLIATSILLVFQSAQTAAGGINVSAVVIACFGIDVTRQMQQVSLATAVFSISTSARARLNAILILSPFTGQALGTSVRSQVFIQHGWRACALLMLASYGFQFGILVLRGPHCPRNHWFGWVGGFEVRKSVVEARNREDASKVAIPHSIDEPQPPEKMEENLVKSTESGDAANAA
ncbi:hypothetical protein OG21DRAFT_1522967 [Imleria badia]|nr:hypothetical protein OG21DRAFT_1522967 [Imleria badia]